MNDAPIGPDPLNASFDALKTRATPPGDDLMARVLSDADAAQAEFLAPPPAVRPSAWSRFVGLIGGWPSLAGLATASLAGVWIGISQSDTLVQSSEAVLFGDVRWALVDLDPEFGFADAEGGL